MFRVNFITNQYWIKDITIKNFRFSKWRHLNWFVDTSNISETQLLISEMWSYICRSVLTRRNVISTGEDTFLTRQNSFTKTAELFSLYFTLLTRLPSRLFPHLSVFYESGSHLLAAVCHTLISEGLESEPVRWRSGRNFPPGAVVSVSWSCCYSQNSLFPCCVVPPPLWSLLSWVNIWFHLFLCGVNLPLIQSSLVLFSQLTEFH